MEQHVGSVCFKYNVLLMIFPEKKSLWSDPDIGGIFTLDLALLDTILWLHEMMYSLGTIRLYPVALA